VTAGAKLGGRAHVLLPRPVTSEHGDGVVTAGGEVPATCRQLDPFHVQVSDPGAWPPIASEPGLVLTLTPPKSTIDPDGPSAIDAPERPLGCVAAVWSAQTGSVADHEYSCPACDNAMA
jgi:hypothetical protein